jgi:DNA polymerase III epsilon subunit family exonuclease
VLTTPFPLGSPPPASGLTDVPFVAFDTETTGLGPAGRLVEIGAVRFCGEHVEAEWSALVDPGMGVPAEATAVHGLRRSDLAGAPAAGEVLPDFLAFVHGAALVAHNAPFDVGVVGRELLRAGLPLPNNPVLDTCAIPRRLQVAVPNHRLATLAQAFGLRERGTHRALTDARVTGALFRAYLRQLGPAADGLVRVTLTRDLLTFRQLAMDAAASTPLLALLRRARAENRAVVLGGEAGHERRVTPHDLYVLDGATYLEGFCHDDGAVRTFRADDIAAARLA